MPKHHRRLSQQASKHCGSDCGLGPDCVQENPRPLGSGFWSRQPVASLFFILLASPICKTEAAQVQLLFIQLGQGDPTTYNRSPAGGRKQPLGVQSSLSGWTLAPTQRPGECNYSEALGLICASQQGWSMLEVSGSFKSVARSGLDRSQVSLA